MHKVWPSCKTFGVNNFSDFGNRQPKSNLSNTGFIEINENTLLLLNETIVNSIDQ